MRHSGMEIKSSQVAVRHCWPWKVLDKALGRLGILRRNPSSEITGWIRRTDSASPAEAMAFRVLCKDGNEHQPECSFIANGLVLLTVGKSFPFLLTLRAGTREGCR